MADIRVKGNWREPGTKRSDVDASGIGEQRWSGKSRIVGDMHKGAVVAGCPQKSIDYTPTACAEKETITEKASRSAGPVLKATTIKAGPSKEPSKKRKTRISGNR
ncbi:unnamed protein product [Acanthoscelides obtectus]|uniref:Uncharacterized protein n=1 Tax=Acanthoscelides obtectus TaxID=200917 RepID=A0A9P0JP04_ACAOB|nr:unnamed protein product [Acanthoscelides obtectus]CAK1642904.1 hypothetical protein AOBTE_LOCUS13281 [Acanthoscelides obtectus]